MAVVGVSLAPIRGWEKRAKIQMEFAGVEEEIPYSIFIPVDDNLEVISQTKAVPIFTYSISFEEASDYFSDTFGVKINVENGIKVEPNLEPEKWCSPFSTTFQVIPEFTGTPDDFPLTKSQTVMQYLYSEVASMFTQKQNGRKGFRLHYTESGLVCPQKHQEEFLVVYSDEKEIWITTLKKFKEMFPDRPFGICPVLPCKTNTEE